MPIVVKAVTEDEFNAWVREQGGTVPGEPGPAEPAEPAASDSAADPVADTPGVLPAVAGK
jgi:heme/copper-type cytochrome/quinol oxidase subunit 2